MLRGFKFGVKLVVLRFSVSTQTNLGKLKIQVVVVINTGTRLPLRLPPVGVKVLKSLPTTCSVSVLRCPPCPFPELCAWSRQ